jgi:hypothetical protein
MKDFHNVFSYYGRLKPKNIKCQKKLHIFISYDVMLEYICVKNNTSQRIKKCKYNQEMIEMIFDIVEICEIY